jgi:hypothetical protein
MLIEDVDGPSLRERCVPGPWKGNAVVVINPEQQLVYAARWLKTELLRKFLDSYLAADGQVEPVADEGGPPQ